MRTIIAGSRDATPDDVAAGIIACPWRAKISVVLSGTARGADIAGEMYAREAGLPIERYPAEWETYGKAAGPIRNRAMVARAEALLAIWDWASPGTGHIVAEARKHGLTIFIHRIAQSPAPESNREKPV